MLGGDYNSASSALSSLLLAKLLREILREILELYEVLFPRGETDKQQELIIFSLKPNVI
ncbi:MAG TPA: hypothetical protein VFZ67_05195 [Nitrososphaera sp.]